MSTFETIEGLIDELDRHSKAQSIMLDHGMVSRTDAGARFFTNDVKYTIEIMKELRLFPHEWVEAVRVAVAVRRNENIKSRVPIL